MAFRYHASKHYLRGLSDALDWELQDTDVAVTTLCPGFTRTQFFDAATPFRSEAVQANLKNWRNANSNNSE